MCNGESNRASQGGTIAFLRPTTSTQRPSLRRELSLCLASDNNDGRTTATFQGFDPSLGHASHVVIHRDGDLRSAGEASVLYQFAIPQLAQASHSFSLDRNLDLGVGGEGIIGRRVSLMSQQTVLGEGIMGWN